MRRATALTNTDGLASDEELEEIYTPDVVLDFSARAFNPKVYKGYEGLRRFYAESREVWDKVTLTIDEIIAEGDRYVVLGQGRARGRASGMEVTAGFTAIWVADAGRLTHFRLLSTAEADRELGLAALRDPS